jgi:hypothetical protein
LRRQAEIRLQIVGPRQQLGTSGCQHFSDCLPQNVWERFRFEPTERHVQTFKQLYPLEERRYRGPRRPHDVDRLI